jgi:hypothetical protein
MFHIRKQYKKYNKETLLMVDNMVQRWKGLENNNPIKTSCRTSLNFPDSNNEETSEIQLVCISLHN